MKTAVERSYNLAEPLLPRTHITDAGSNPSAPNGPTIIESSLMVSNDLNVRGNDDDEASMNDQSCFYRFLGFPKPIGCGGSNRILSSPLLHMAMLSNLSTSYNVINVGYVLDVMAQSNSTYAEQRTSESDGLCASSLLFGMVFGQLCGGVLGDQMSRQKALFVVMWIQIISSLGSAFLLFDSSNNFTVYDSLAVWRFCLGLGCGGVYPLAATMTSELVSASSSSSATQAASNIDEGHEGALAEKIKSKLVAITFSTQGVGFLLVPLVTWLVVTILGVNSSSSSNGSEWAWKIILAFGCLPGLLVILLQCCATCGNENMSVYGPIQEDAQTRELENISNEHGDHCVNGEQPLDSVVSSPVDVSWMAGDSDDESDMDDAHASLSPSILTAIRQEPRIVRKLGGTAACWFLFDILFYGNTLFTPVVLKQAFGASETIASTACDAFILTLLALPGYCLSVVTLGRFLSPKWVQMQGFAFMGVLYLAIGVYFKIIGQHKIVLLLLYGMTFMFANWGPNTTTFLLPSLTFSKECRSTLNGVAAACGKMGALLGSTAFEPLAKQYGDAVVMILCAGVSAIGFLLTFLCLDGQEKRQHHNLEQGSLSQLNASGDDDHSNKRVSAVLHISPREII
jgi:PHS family inorganic phosphate transporter-like MFS transporter